VDTHANPDAQWDNLASDISIYAADNIPDADTGTDFSKMELFVELKLAETSDPFRDPKDPLQPPAENFRFENVSDVSRLNRGQLSSYTAAHAGSQFRVHTFTLSMQTICKIHSLGSRRRDCYQELRLHQRTAYPCQLFLALRASQP
jgi:hypothetical protein